MRTASRVVRLVETTICLFLLLSPAYALDAVDFAVAQLGKDYEWGGNGPDAFDCSGLVRSAYAQVGVELPRTSRQQSEVGEVVTGQLQRGDLLFFSTIDDQPGEVTHVGIYEGDDRMINAEWYGIGVIREDITSDYWSSRLIFARRVAHSFIEQKKLTASDGAAGDMFGLSVSVSGDTAIVGAALDDDNGSDSGSAYVFERSQGGANNWGEVKKLTASDGAADDLFGYSVAISGETAIVGAAVNVRDSAPSGSAYIFERNQGGANNWGEVKKLTASDGDPSDAFGISVSVSGDTAIVGAVLDENESTDPVGSAYIFERNQGGANNWGEVKKLTASLPILGSFGHSVSISGNTAIVGAPSLGAGSAHVFERNQGGANNWGEVKKLTASDGAVDNQFGLSVSISGDTVIVGEPFDDRNPSNSGSVYIFQRNQGGANNWGEVQKLSASDAAAAGAFGFSVAISGGTVIVGENTASPGSAYVFSQ